MSAIQPLPLFLLKYLNLLPCIFHVQDTLIAKHAFMTVLWKKTKQNKKTFMYMQYIKFYRIIFTNMTWHLFMYYLFSYFIVSSYK